MQRLIEYVSFNPAFSPLSYTAGPAGSHEPPAAQVIPYLMYLAPSYSKLRSHCSQDAVPCYIHSTQPTCWWYPLMSSEAHLEATQDPPNNIAPIQKRHIQALPPWGGHSRISVQGTSFTAFLVQVRKLAAHCSKVAALFIVFSAVTGKLNWVCPSTEEENWKAALFSLQA